MFPRNHPSYEREELPCCSYDRREFSTFEVSQAWQRTNGQCTNRQFYSNRLRASSNQGTQTSYARDNIPERARYSERRENPNIFAPLEIPDEMIADFNQSCENLQPSFINDSQEQYFRPYRLFHSAPPMVNRNYQVSFEANLLMNPNDCSLPQAETFIRPRNSPLLYSENNVFAEQNSSRSCEQQLKEQHFSTTITLYHLSEICLIQMDYESYDLRSSRLLLGRLRNYFIYKYSSLSLASYDTQRRQERTYEAFRTSTRKRLCENINMLRLFLERRAPLTDTVLELRQVEGIDIQFNSDMTYPDCDKTWSLIVVSYREISTLIMKIPADPIIYHRFHYDCKNIFFSLDEEEWILLKETNSNKYEQPYNFYGLNNMMYAIPRPCDYLVVYPFSNYKPQPNNELNYQNGPRMQYHHNCPQMSAPTFQNTASNINNTEILNIAANIQNLQFLTNEIENQNAAAARENTREADSTVVGSGCQSDDNSHISMLIRSFILSIGEIGNKNFKTIEEVISYILVFVIDCLTSSDEELPEIDMQEDESYSEEMNPEMTRICDEIMHLLNNRDRSRDQRLNEVKNTLERVLRSQMKDLRRSLFHQEKMDIATVKPEVFDIATENEGEENYSDIPGIMRPDDAAQLGNDQQ